jgi:hypothetical protein
MARRLGAPPVGDGWGKVSRPRVGLRLGRLCSRLGEPHAQLIGRHGGGRCPIGKQFELLARGATLRFEM